MTLYVWAGTSVQGVLDMGWSLLNSCLLFPVKGQSGGRLQQLFLLLQHPEARVSGAYGQLIRHQILRSVLLLCAFLQSAQENR